MDETDNSKTINEFYQWENEGFIPPVTKPQEEFLNHGKHTLQTVSNYFQGRRTRIHDSIRNNDLEMQIINFHLKAHWSAFPVRQH